MKRLSGSYFSNMLFMCTGEIMLQSPGIVTGRKRSIHSLYISTITGARTTTANSSSMETTMRALLSLVQSIRGLLFGRALSVSKLSCGIAHFIILVFKLFRKFLLAVKVFLVFLCVAGRRIV